jgi:synaptotagmin-14/16
LLNSPLQLTGCAGELTSLARSDSTGSTHSMQHGGVPELLLGLCYNATTGRLSIEVVKGSHFRNLALNRAPDTYVKLNLVSSTGQELSHSKTTVRRGQPNPLFKETFVFQVSNPFSIKQSSFACAHIFVVFFFTATSLALLA